MNIVGRFINGNVTDIHSCLQDIYSRNAGHPLAP